MPCVIQKKRTITSFKIQLKDKQCINPFQHKIDIRMGSKS